ncbi:MAG: hypothetical protein K8S25_01350 [Alphaproteobacteria bacterium]|nr:hypothetical protein [Alphaproteobacteria bacterium]
MSGIHLTGDQKERLKRALATGSQLGASHLRLLNTDVYRERLGSEWFKYRGIIEAISIDAIKAQLRENDVFVQTPHGYALFFFSRSEEDTKTLTERIAQDVAAQLSREREFRDPPIQCKPEPITPSELLRQLEENNGRAARPVPAIAAPGEPAAQAGYGALWHAKMERVVGCVCDVSGEPSIVPIPNEKYYEESKRYMKQDISLFNSMLVDIFKLIKTGEKAAILFSINFRSFCAAELNKEYMHALRQTPSNLLPFLTPRFVRIPPGAPSALIAAKTQLLASVFKHVALHTSPEADLNRFQFLPNAMLATSWRDVSGASGSQARITAVDTLSRFCKAAKSLRLSSVIGGVAARDAYEAVLSSGADFVTGEFISGQTRSPSSQYRLTAAEIRGERAESRKAADARVAYV